MRRVPPRLISSVRQRALRPSRSTMRSTTSFAIRRNVVSLPPVIVSSPVLPSSSVCRRDMSLGVDVGLSVLRSSGRLPAQAPTTSSTSMPLRNSALVADRM